MHKLTFSIGLILLITFSIFSPLKILKIENVNAQVTVPKNYIQTVNDPYINSEYAWENFTTGLDPDSYAHVQGPQPYYPFDYDWVNLTLGTPYNGWGNAWNRNWTMQNHSPNNDSILVCLEGGYIGGCDPDWDLFEPFSNYLTVITHINLLCYTEYAFYNGSSINMTWVVPLVSALRTMGFAKVYFLGVSSGAMGVASWFIHYDNGTIFDSGAILSGYLNNNHEHGVLPNLCNMSNYAGNVTTKLCLIAGEDDWNSDYGSAWVQSQDFYSNLTVPGSELHRFTGDHDVLNPLRHDVTTGKNAVQVVTEFLGLYYYSEFGTFTAYAKRVGADEWGDCIARQGYYPHLNSYCLDWNNKIIKPMLHYPYIPADIGDGQIILQASGKHSEPIWYGYPATGFLWPTIGATIMLYFNVFVHDNINNVDKWLFNFHEPNPFAGPNMFLLEIFMTRWIVPYPLSFNFESVSPGFWAFEGFTTRTTHDNDLHMITCPFEMPVNNEWYSIMYDVGYKLQDCAEKIEDWACIRGSGGQKTYVYDVLGFQLMTIAMGVESIGGSWTFQFGDVSLTDMRWGTGSAYTNTMIAELKTRADGNQYIPKLSGVIGSPNVLRPYMTYTKDALDSDINDDGYVNAKDSIRLGTRFGSMESDPDGSSTYPSWDYTSDIIKDRFVNGMDATRFGAMFGQTGTYQTGLGTLKVWMQEFDISGGLGLYWPDPPPGYVGPPWSVMRTVPYTCNLYLEMWDIIDWPFHVGKTISFNPCQNYMDRMVFYNGTTLSQTGICLYAYAYPIYD